MTLKTTKIVNMVKNFIAIGRWGELDNRCLGQLEQMNGQITHSACDLNDLLV